MTRKLNLRHSGLVLILYAVILAGCASQKPAIQAVAPVEEVAPI